MPYPPDLIVDNETVPVLLPAVTGRLIVSSGVAGSVSFAFVSISFRFRPINTVTARSSTACTRSYRYVYFSLARLLLFSCFFFVFCFLLSNKKNECFKRLSESRADARELGIEGTKFKLQIRKFSDSVGSKFATASNVANVRSGKLTGRLVLRGVLSLDV